MCNLETVSVRGALDKLVQMQKATMEKSEQISFFVDYQTCDHIDQYNDECSNSGVQEESASGEGWISFWFFMSFPPVLLRYN